MSADRTLRDRLIEAAKNSPCTRHGAKLCWSQTMDVTHPECAVDAVLARLAADGYTVVKTGDVATITRIPLTIISSVGNAVTNDVLVGVLADDLDRLEASVFDRVAAPDGETSE